MAEPDISAFIDSNIFLQCRDIKDLAWHSVLGVTGWVEIVISPAIIGELDKKKIDRNPRLRTRSRAALAQIEQASTFADERIELKAKLFAIYHHALRYVKVFFFLRFLREIFC